MAIKINDLIFVHSGGASNVTPSADLGGAISTAGGKRILSQSSTTPNTITGVVITDAFGNPEGVGSLQYTNATKTLGWKPYGQTTYYGVSVSTNGTYLIGSSAGYLVVTVTYASLPSSDKVDSLTISNVQQNVFDNVTAAQALAGKVSYRCHYVLNSHATDTAVDVRIWIKTPTPAGDELAIGLGTSAIGSTEQTIANETTAPTSVSFSAPASYASSLVIGNLAAGQWKAVWQRRTVPAETRGTVIANTAVLALAATV
jgi:hypothetical protein